MKIKFHIEYHTILGQRMMVYGNIPELGNGQDAQAVPMEMCEHAQGHWYTEIEIPVEKSIELQYQYVLVDEQHGVRFREFGPMRTLSLKKQNQGSLILWDKWNPSKDPENVLFSSAFVNALAKPQVYKNSQKTKKLNKDEVLVEFQISTTRIEPGHRVALYGSGAGLGNWNFENIILMESTGYPKWTAKVVLKKSDFPIQYKYCVVSNDTKEFIFDEAFDNRMFTYNDLLDVRQIVIADRNFRYPRCPWKGAGVALPVFSLRTKNGFGVGEFLDIKPLVDWAKRTGLKLIQILPINDTVATHSWLDSCPYSAISVFALHPIYLNLNAIGHLSSPLAQEIVEEQRRCLNALEQIDYEKVMLLKSKFFKRIYDEQKNQFLKDPDFHQFFESNAFWLKSYAAFSYLRDFFSNVDYSTWGRFATYSEKMIEELVDPNTSHYDDIAVHYFIQYHLHKQMIEASHYARTHGVVLKGDIPIGIYRNSVDAWVNPSLYNLSVQAGAPPDDFSEKGQNWKFPTYNWEVMQKDNFLWWRKRLEKMSEYFDAYRIDHILGFFRIWEIPEHSVEGIMGWFNPAIPFHRNEISDKGIWFDYDRYCKPYIRSHMLHPIFGADTDYVKSEFLDETHPGVFQMKTAFDTQKKVEKFLSLGPDASSEQRGFNDRIKLGLFRLLSEVLFFEVPESNGTYFHPRHSMFKTISYQALDDDTRRKLYELYIHYFYSRNESFWYEQAMIKLPAIKNATNMLSCGEDLGMVPDCVPTLMNELGILSLEVQRMPKDPKITFGHPADYPYPSVATPSSHDTSTIRGWWEEDSTRSQHFYNEILGKWGASPYYCEPEIVQDILVQHVYSPSMWAIFPIQDLLGIDKNLRNNHAGKERINLPSIPVYYWRYRFHLNIEDLMKEDAFNDRILELLTQSGRASAY